MTLLVAATALVAGADPWSSASCIVVPRLVMMARSMTLSSSRTLPTHSRDSRSFIVARVTSRSRTPHAAAVLLDEVVHEQRNVLAPLPQRRQRDGEHVEAVPEVFAEAARLHLLEEVAIGRGDDARVGLERDVAADALELAVLEHAQQLGLQVQRQLADFVEEERGAVGDLEPTLAASRPRPVNAPFSCPNSSLSMSVGGSAAQFTRTSGR